MERDQRDPRPQGLLLSYQVVRRFEISCNPGRLCIIDVAIYDWLGRRGYFKIHWSRHRNACPTGRGVGRRSCVYSTPLLTRTAAQLECSHGYCRCHPG